jgi:hypothetical protein
MLDGDDHYPGEQHLCHNSFFTFSSQHLGGPAKYGKHAPDKKERKKERKYKTQKFSPFVMAAAGLVAETITFGQVSPVLSAGIFQQANS